MHESADRKFPCNTDLFPLLLSITMRVPLVISACMIACMGRGQVRVDGPLQLTGSDDAERQVTGLAPLNDPAAALSVEGERRVGLTHAEPGMAPSWVVDIPALPGVPVAGTHITVKVPDGATGEVTILLNGLGPYDVITGPAAPLQAEQVATGSVLSLVFLSNSFQLMNGTTRALRPCPIGTVAVNGQYCIETQQDTAIVDFFNAARICGERGLRLCSWAEFHMGCANAAVLGLQNMTGDHEWIGSACNEDGSARIAGFSGCTSVACALAAGSTDRPFRCCTDR